jgi:hypothetical protein
MASGVSVTGNIVVDTELGIQVGGGRDNHLQWNLVSKAQVPMQFDSRGTDDRTGQYDRYIRNVLATINTELPIWQRYEWVLSSLYDEPLVPKRNFVQNNVFVTSAPFRVYGTVPFTLVQYNYIGMDPGYYDLATLDLRMLAGSNAAANGYQAPNVAGMGLLPGSIRPLAN